MQKYAFFASTMHKPKNIIAKQRQNICSIKYLKKLFSIRLQMTVNNQNRLTLN